MLVGRALVLLFFFSDRRCSCFVFDDGNNDPDVDGCLVENDDDGTDCEVSGCCSRGVGAVAGDFLSSRSVLAATGAGATDSVRNDDAVITEEATVPTAVAVDTTTSVVVSQILRGRPCGDWDNMDDINDEEDDPIRCFFFGGSSSTSSEISSSVDSSSLSSSSVRFFLFLFLLLVLARGVDRLGVIRGG